MQTIRLYLAKVKQEFPDYKFYSVGGWARIEKYFSDYDIGIIPKKANYGEWESLLKNFYSLEFDDKNVDAQIVPAYKKIFKMEASKIRKCRDNKIFRYVYSDKIMKSREEYNIKYYRVRGNLWLKVCPLVSKKHRDMGLMNFKYFFEEL